MALPRRRLAVLATGAIAVLLVAIPVLGADPSAPASATPSSESSPSSEPTSASSPESFAPSSEPSGEAAPSSETPRSSGTKPPDAVPDPVEDEDESGKPDKPGKADKGDKSEGVPTTVTGTVAAGTDGKGRPTYTLSANGTTWELSDGPPWFWGDKNPLNAYVGKSVTIVGTAEAGSTELEVETVDGTAIREPGKPPWAGGPWVVGPTHPGWKPWMADGKPGKGAGKEHAPGQNKDKTKDKSETETDKPD